MMRRIHIQNDTHFCEFPDTLAGKIQAMAFRKTHKEFKGKRLRFVLQLIPSAVPCGVIMERE